MAQPASTISAARTAATKLADAIIECRDVCELIQAQITIEGQTFFSAWFDTHPDCGLTAAEFANFSTAALHYFQTTAYVSEAPDPMRNVLEAMRE